MSRPLRMEYAGAVYHVTSRGDQRGSIFHTEHDRMRFLETLGRVAELYGWRVHAWCQMTNHYHLLVETPEPNLCRGMQQLNGHYAAHFNRSNGRVGHVFQGRYKAIFIERESYLLEVARYVVLNPVRAKMVRAAADWSWSSYRDTAGHRSSPAWLTIETEREEELLDLTGFEYRCLGPVTRRPFACRRTRYRALAHHLPATSL